MESLLVPRLVAEKRILVTVESCTGGLLADRITNVSGSSNAFWGSWIAYDNSAKTALGVPFDLIERHGAVSAPVALAMAEAGLENLRRVLAGRSPRELNVPREPRSLIALSTTGIAGPTGGTPQKPVGLCYIGLAASDGTTRSIDVRAPKGSGRIECKRFFSDRAFELLRDYLALLR